MSKMGYDGAVEEPHGFILYKIIGTECYIGEIYVEKSKRQLGIASELADKVTDIALANGCTILTCETNLCGHEDELSMLSILHYGFRPIQAHNNSIRYMKEIR